MLRLDLRSIHLIFTRQTLVDLSVNETACDVAIACILGSFVWDEFQRTSGLFAVVEKPGDRIWFFFGAFCRVSLLPKSVMGEIAALLCQEFTTMK